MLALRFDHFGPPFELQLEELPKPVLMPDAVKAYEQILNRTAKGRVAIAPKQ